MDPPQCVQNAMMTKDKKPFTYTPGGIDLSEVRSPRMARRIERNANLEGVSEVPRTQPPPNVGPLPPSALAAMRPQTQVQVFPAPPPPPPVNKSMPPPPPPPMCPLPTQKVTTGDNQVLERPDMTKIIPDNPMALLRKTGGPAPRKNLVEEMYSQESKAPPSPPQRQHQPAPLSPPVQQYQPPIIERSPPIQAAQPPMVERSPPVQQQRTFPSPQYQPEPQQQRAFQPPQYQPPVVERSPPIQQQNRTPQPYQNSTRATDSPKPNYQTPIIERQATLPRQNDQPARVINSNVGSLYIPPINQHEQQRKVATPPSPPERQYQAQSPGGANLKEAPRPWQTKSAQQQQELPPWARKEDESPQQVPQTSQPRWPQTPQTPQTPARSPQPQYAPQSPTAQPQGVHIEIRSVPYPQQQPSPDEKKPNAVYITQPVVLQHPGAHAGPPPQRSPQPRPQQQQNNVQNSFQQPRQPNQQPKVDNQGTRIIPIQIEGRGPSSPPSNERNLNRQLSWSNQPPQSNSFKVIQKITKTDDEDDDTPVTQHSPRYTQQMPEQMRRMKVNDNDRFKQGDGQPQKYIHPSEQVVPEPKKYMGGNIPSRSFKMLQAMTAPDSCANANYNEELPYNPGYPPYGYPYYPPPPYWHDYYPPLYAPNQPEPSRVDGNNARSGRSTPLPMVPMYPPPYWGYMPGYPQQETQGQNNPKEVRNNSTPQPYYEEQMHYPSMPMYPPYFDPYCYGYYYGYPPYPYYGQSTETDELTGYSSADEMSSYSRRSSLKRRNSLENNVQSLRQHFEMRSKSAAPRVPVKASTPETSHSSSQNSVKEDSQNAIKEDSPKLKSIKSVTNINVYQNENFSDSETSESEESTEEEEEDEIEEEEEVSIVEEPEEIIPHQLSVIFEESERTESRALRPSSVISESTTIAERSDEEDIDFDVKITEDNVEVIKTTVESNVDKDKNATMVNPNVTDSRRESNSSKGSDKDFWGILGNEEVGEKPTKCIYDEFKDPDSPEPVDNKGKIMEMESFVEKLEQIKRSSGLWDLENVDFSDQQEPPMANVEPEDIVERTSNKSGSSEEIDFWSQIKNDEEDFVPRPKNTGVEQEEEDVTDSIENKVKANSSTSSRHSSFSTSYAKADADSHVENEQPCYDTSDLEPMSSDEGEDDKPTQPVKAAEEEPKEPQTIKERIEALKNSIAQKQSKLKEVEETTICVKTKVTAIEVGKEERSKTASTKSSVKSFEEYSEEEGDSGVISDLSRHISDTEEFPELRKMTRYERAATHSRLFKLLQDECDDEEEEEEAPKVENKFDKLSVRQNCPNKLSPSRSKLSLPLNKCSESENSVNEKLVDELVQSILKRRKGQVFRNMPKEKLYAAAVRILQEDFESKETPSEEFSSLLSPLRGETENSTPAQTPQEFYSNYNEYKQYYDSWEEAGQAYDESSEILPSKAFKLLQDHMTSNKLGVIEGFLAKCPKVLSSKFVDPNPDSPPSPIESHSANEVSNTS